MTLRENVPLSPLTTLGVGGAARYFVEARSEAVLTEALGWASEHGLPVFVLGGGSNLVVADASFDGLVVRVSVGGFSVRATSDGLVQVTVGAGKGWDDFVQACSGMGFQGVECLAGIPGRVGGTPVQNVGAYGQEVAETIVAVRALDTTTGEIHTFTKDECRFAYRHSRFNTDERGRWVILTVTFALTPNAPPVLKYADLQKHFAEREQTPALFEVCQAVREIRSWKGMVVRDDDPDSKSAGSFFKNPTVAPDVFAQISGGRDKVPHWPQPDGTVKLAAAWLIENSGLKRGQALGNAGLSTKHILALVNRGDATASEIVALARHVQTTVAEQMSVTLSPEPVFVGFSDTDDLPTNAVRYP